MAACKRAWIGISLLALASTAGAVANEEDRLDPALKLLYRTQAGHGRADERLAPRNQETALALVDRLHGARRRVGAARAQAAPAGAPRLLTLLVKYSGDPARLGEAGFRVQARAGTVFTGNLDPSDLGRLVALPGLAFAQTSQPIHAFASTAPGGARAPASRPRSGSDTVRMASASAAGVLVAFVDTGVDFAHQDFRNPDGTTRIKCLLDLSDPGDVNDDGVLDGAGPYGGTLYTEADIDAALSGGTLGEKDTTGHGTHGLSIAAGGDSVLPGVAAGADLLVVKATREDGSLSFWTADLVNALAFVDEKAAELGRPYVLNLSLGTIFSSHDGRSLEEQAIDALVGPGIPGKAVVVAAGNSSDNRGSHFHHLQGRTFVGMESAHALTVPAFTPNPGRGDDRVLLDIWYEGRDKQQVIVRAPASRPDCPEISAPFGEFADYRTPCGNVFIANVGGPNPSNGDIEAIVLVDDWSGTPPAAGTWTVALRGEEIGESGTYHGWLGEDSQVGTAPPYLSGNADNLYLVGKPGGAYNAITVGSWAHHDPLTRFRTSWTDVLGYPRVDTTALEGAISDFSSPGGTRDGRVKPEVAAPGERVVGAVSKDAYPGVAPNSIYRYHSFPQPEALITDNTPDHRFGVLQGTSFAAPVVTGLAARILSENPSLDAIQVRNIIVNSAASDAQTGPVPNEAWGYGKADLAGGGGPGPLPSDLRITVDTLPGGALNRQYNVVLTASGGTLPYSWMVASGTLPPGLSLEPRGFLTGRPTAAGSFSFTVQVADASAPAQTSERSYEVAIDAQPPLAVVTATLPVARIDKPYETELLAEGGALPYAWTLAGGDFPPGLYFFANGVIQGTADVLGSFSFTVQVQDALGAPSYRSLRIRVTSEVGGDWDPLGKTTPTVNAIAVDPNDSSHVMVSTRNIDAVFETRNAGDSWRATSINNNLNTYATYLRTSPSSVPWAIANPSNQLFRFDADLDRWEVRDPPGRGQPNEWAGGLDFTDSDTVFALYAVHPSGPTPTFARSTDQGLSWSAVQGLGCPSPPSTIRSLSIFRPDPSTMFSAAAGTTCISQDGGLSWTDISNLTGGGTELRVSQQDPFDVVKSDSSAIWKSLDGGRNWTPLVLRGSTCCLDRSPTTPSVVIAGTSEGVFKSTDGGQTFRALPVRSLSLNVTSVAVDPANADSYFVGTDQGVFHSEDGGQSWALKNGGLIRRTLGAVAVSRSVPEDVLLVASEGPYVSHTSGEAWTLSREGLANFAIRHGVVSPADPNLFYLSNDEGVFRSDNRGVTWYRPNPSFGAGFGIVAMDADPFDANVVLVSLSGTRGTYRSVDRGQTWSSVNTGLPFVEPTDLSMARDVPGRVYISFRTKGVYRSENRGASWAAFGLNDLTVEEIEPAPSNSGYLYARSGATLHFLDPSGSGQFEVASVGPLRPINDIAVDANEPLIAYAGADHSGIAGETGGIYKTTDGGRTWARLAGILDSFDVVAVSSHPSISGTVYAATLNAGVYRSTDGGATWTELGNFGTVADLTNLTVQDPGNPFRLFAATEGYGVQVSVDRGKTFFPRVSGLTNFQVNALAFDPDDPTTLYAGTDAGIFRSTNSAGSWEFTGQTTGEVTDLATDNDGTARRIWGTVRGEGVASSSDGGATFTLSASGLASLDLTSLEVEVRGTARRIWGTTRGGDGVVYSDDLGQTWRSAAGNGLTDRNINDLAIQQGTGRRIWGTADSGVFVSDNDGLSWTNLSLGLPSGVPVSSVAIDGNSGELLVSLFSEGEGGVYRGGNVRGIWSPFSNGLGELKVRRLSADRGHAVDATTRGTTFYAATAGDGVYASEIRTSAAEPLAVTTAALPDGTMRAAYAATLSAQGGVPPYAWSVAEGALPPGVTLAASSGALGGEPAQVGSFAFTVQVSDANSGTARKTLAIEILDPDVPTLAIDDVAVFEGNSGSATAGFTVTLSRASGQTVTVAYATGDLTAAAGVDYTATAGTLTFAPGTTTRTVTVAVLGDTAVEPDEILCMNLSNASDAVITDSQGLGSIRDDDSPPSLAIADVTVSEGNAGPTNAVFAVTLSRSVGVGVTVHYGTADGTATAPSDYTPRAGTLTFLSGTTSQTITVAVNGDTLVEPDETFTVSLTDAVNATIDRGEAQATVLDEDGIPTLSVADTAATEGAASAVFSITLSTASTGNVELSYATSDGSAIAGTDYEATSGVVAFPPGERVRTVSVPLTAPDDSIDQGPRAFLLTLSPPDGATIADGQATATIVDNDTRFLSIDSPRVTEGTPAVFTVSLDAPSARTITVDFATVPGTAAAGVDYQTTSGRLTFPPGTSVQTISVPVSGNAVDEPNETFRVVLSNPVNARIAPRQGPLNMTWSQLGPTPPFGPSHSCVKAAYDATTDRLMVFQTCSVSAWVLENALVNDATSRWRQLSPSGTAPAGREWAAVVYDPGSNRLILHGGTAGGRETWVLTGANGLGAAQWIRLPDLPGNPHWGGGTNYDRGTNRLIVFGSYVADIGWTTEVWVLKDANGLGTAQWVQLSPGGVPPHVRSTTTQSVAYDPGSNRLILFGGDNAPGTASNPSGLDNDLWVLTHANGLGGVPAWIRLAPDGTPPAPRSHHSAAYDPLTNQLYLFGGYKGYFGSLVGHVAVDDTWLLTGANGVGAAPRWVQVPTTGPAARYLSAYTSGGETALVVLQGGNINQSAPYNDLWALKDLAAGTATILDDDPAPTLSVNDTSVIEGNAGLRNAVFTVSLSNPSERPIEVACSTADGSARSGPDYVATSGSLTIPAGQTSGTFGIPVKGDVFLEGDETFLVNLTSASNATIGDGQGQGTILNDDVPSPNAPVPALQSVDPVAKAPGSGGFELRAFGANFVPSSVVRWNGTNRATTFVSARELRAAITASDAATARVAQVSAFTPAPGGGRSESLPFVVGPASTTVSFTRTDLSTGTGSRPVFVAAADLNADGRADLVTANAEADSLSVLLGNGPGTFAPRVDYPAGDGPQWLRVADLDKDGDLDLVVANYNSSDVSILLGNGDGTFATRVDYAAGVGNLNAVVATDFNADGLLDLAVGGTTGVSVLLRNGDGTYLSPGYVSAQGYGIWTLGVGDFNGDAKPDLLAGIESQVLLLTGNGEGVFSVSPAVSWGSRMQAVPADLNQDGALDFVCAMYGWASVNSWLGNNAGNFAGSAAFGPPSPYFPVVADFNADGTVDVAATNIGSGSVSVSLGFGTPTEFAVGQTPRGAAAADFNGDGRMDLVTANYASDTVSVLTNAPPSSLTIGDISVSEGNLGGKEATLTVTLSPATIATVTVNYGTADGTARAGEDYVGAWGSLTFQPGETTKTVTVTIFGDTTYEPNEAFFLDLSGINGALLADSRGQATVVNDDSGAILSVDDVTVPEGDSGSPVAAFTVSMPAPVPSGQTVTVSYTTADGTATAGMDYQSVSGVLTFTQGQSSRVVSVPVIPDTVDELDETFTLNLSGASGAVIGDAQGVATIVDDDQATLTIGDVTVTESHSGLKDAVFELTLSAPSAVDVVVGYATADNSARSGPDYVATSGSVTIPAGATSGTIGVPVKGDLFFEGDETFFVNVTSATNATVGDGQGQCTILNDDVPSADGPVPALQSIEPVAAAPRGAGFQLRVFGANLLPTSVVRWNGADRATTFVSARELKASIAAADVATAGVARVSVFTPAPGGGSSSPLPFVVSPASSVVSFTRSNLSTGSHPAFVATADLNGDGREDFVTANNGSATVSVFLGNGDGTFRPRVNYPTGDNPNWVHVADLDKDGDAELVVADFTSGDVSILLGNGDGTFAPRVDYAAGAGNAHAVVAGDFNGDGLLDLAAGGTNGVSVLLRSGDGTYVSPGCVSASGNWYAMLGTGDFNGDARLDLLGTGAGVQLLTGNGEGVFSIAVQPWCCAEPRALPADLNRDGALDFLFIPSPNWNPGVSALFGDNVGGFPSSTNSAGLPSPYSPAVADFNADGVLDSAWSNIHHASVSLVLASGVYSIGAPTEFAAGQSPYGAAAADFNGDGRMDLVTANLGSDTVSILTSAPPPSLAIGDISATEGNLGGTDAIFTVTLSPATIATVTVNYATADGTATAGSDYVAKSGSLTFLPGETTKAVAVTIFGDTAYEPDETFFLDLSGINGAVLADARGQATVINDDSGFLLSVNDGTVTEGNAGSPQAAFTVSMPVAVPVGQTVTVNYTTADGTATAGADYQATSGTLTFSAGQSSRTIAVPLVPDLLDEPDETFTMNLSNASGAVIVDAQGVATITDDDDVTLSVADVAVTEGSAGLADATFTASLSAPSGRTIDLDYATADDTARAGPDYVATSGRVSFPPGATSASFSVPVRGDRFLEPDESFLVNLTATPGVILGAGQARGSIRNDDMASADNPVPALHVLDPVSALPGSDGFELRVIGSNLLPTSVVRWNDFDRTTTFVSARELRAAIPATDLLTAGVAHVSVFSPSPGGGRSETRPFVVSLPSSALSFARADIAAGDGPSFVAADDLNGDGHADLVVAQSESDAISVWLGNGDGTFAPPVGYAAGDGPSWVAVADLDQDGDLDLAVTNLGSGIVSVFRGDGAGGFAPRADYDCGAQPSSVAAADFNADGKLDLAVGGGSGQGVSVLLGNGDGTFLSPGYVSGISSYPVSNLAAGEYTGEGRLDLVAGYQHGVQLLAGNGEGVFSMSQVAGGCCTDWRVAPADFNRDGALDFMFVPYNGAENGATVLFGNNAGGFWGGPGSPGMPSPNFPVVADFNADSVLDSVWTNGSHASVSLLLGAGYYGFQSPTTFPTGSHPRGAAAADFNGDGRLDVAVANFDSDTVSILTNTPAPALSVSNTGTYEGNALTIDTVFTVTLSPPSVATVTVNYSTADGTATAGSDYVAKSGSLTFLPGETTKSVPVTVFGDRTYEPDETFFLNVSGEVGAEIADGQGRATIVNDDTGFELSVSDVSVGEGGAGPAEAVFTVSMPIAVPAGETVTVGYSAADGTARAGLDYQAVAGTLTFAEGEWSKTVAVPLLPDVLDEADETFFLNLADPAGALIVDGQGRATIADDDPLPQLTVDDVSVVEGTTTTHALFTVSLSPPSGRDVTVSYATADGTAVAGADYLPASGTLTFAPGMTARTVAVMITEDTVAEGDESFFLDLGPETSAEIADGRGQGTIEDIATLRKAEITSPVPGTRLSSSTVAFVWGGGEGVSAYWLTVEDAPGRTIYSEYQGTALSRTVSGLPTDGRTLHVRLSSLLGASWDFSDYSYLAALGPGTALTINDVGVREGKVGRTAAVFTVSLSSLSASPVTVAYATSDGTATARRDYTPTAGTLTFAPGQLTRTLAVAVTGDTAIEPNETFFVVLSSPTGATLADDRGQGVIVNDDPLPRDSNRVRRSGLSPSARRDLGSARVPGIQTARPSVPMPPAAAHEEPPRNGDPDPAGSPRR